MEKEKIVDYSILRIWVFIALMLSVCGIVLGLLALKVGPLSSQARLAAPTTESTDAVIAGKSVYCYKDWTSNPYTGAPEGVHWICN